MSRFPLWENHGPSDHFQRHVFEPSLRISRNIRIAAAAFKFEISSSGWLISRILLIKVNEQTCFCLFYFVTLPPCRFGSQRLPNQRVSDPHLFQTSEIDFNYLTFQISPLWRGVGCDLRVWPVDTCSFKWAAGNSSAHPGHQATAIRMTEWVITVLQLSCLSAWNAAKWLTIYISAKYSAICIYIYMIIYGNTNYI